MYSMNVNDAMLFGSPLQNLANGIAPTGMEGMVPPYNITVKRYFIDEEGNKQPADFQVTVRNAANEVVDQPVQPGAESDAVVSLPAHGTHTVAATLEGSAPASLDGYTAASKTLTIVMDRAREIELILVPSA